MNLLAAHFDEQLPVDKPAVDQPLRARWLARLRVACARVWTELFVTQYTIPPLSPRAQAAADVVMLILGMLAYLYFMKLMNDSCSLLPAGR